MTAVLGSGDRVELVVLTDDYRRFGLAAGDCGTVRFTDSLGTVHIHWDSGRRAGILASVRVNPPALLRDGFASLDPAATPLDLGACEKDGRAGLAERWPPLGWLQEVPEVLPRFGGVCAVAVRCAEEAEVAADLG